MICQRSGRCCVTCGVPIGVFDPTLKDWRWKLKPGMVRCPNLLLQRTGEAQCVVHEEPWYKFTPCFSHGNPDIDPDHAAFPNKPCMIGKANRESNLNVTRDADLLPPEEMKDIGPLRWTEDGIDWSECGILESDDGEKTEV